MVTKIKTLKLVRSFTQERAQITYVSILEAAARLFPRLGFDATQMADIAAEAGISTGAVYRYFEDKRQVFLEMAEFEIGKIRGDIEGRLAALDAGSLTRDAGVALGHVLDTVFDQIKKDAALARVFTAMALTDPDVAALKARSDTRDREAIAAMIEASVPRGVVSNPAATAAVVHAAAVGLATELAFKRKKGTAAGPSDDELRAALHEMLVAFFFGHRTTRRTT